jgi:copper(I)-binding protein
MSFGMSMKLYKSVQIIVMLLLACASYSIFAHGFKVGEIIIAHPYAYPSIPGANNGVAYIKSIKNEGSNTIKLLRASSAIAQGVEIHQMKMDGNTMKMRAIQYLEIPANSEIKLDAGNPQGLHIMLIGIKRTLKEGDRFPLILQFDDDQKVEVEVWVERQGNHLSTHQMH